MTKNENKIFKILEKSGSTHLFTDIFNLSGPTIFFEPIEKFKDESKFNVGATKLYGQPHFPKNLPWPTGRVQEVDFDKKNDYKPYTKEINYPFSFLAQINLKEITKYIPNIPKLSQSGILYFFISPSYDELTKIEGDLVSRDAYKVLFYDGPISKLAPLIYPKFPRNINDKELNYKNFNKVAERVNIDFDITLAYITELINKIPTIPQNDLNECIKACVDYSRKITQMFGYPVPIQDMQSQYNKDNILLYSCLGPHGQVCYFFISKKDFKKGIFTNVELVIQGT